MLIQTQSVLPKPPARRSKFYYFFGKIKIRFSHTFLGKFLFSPVRVLLSNCSTVGQGFDSPLVHCRSVFSCVLSMCLLSFPQICLNFRAFTPSSIFPKISHNFRVYHDFWELPFCASVILKLLHASALF